MGIQYVDKNADAVGTVADSYVISGSNNQFSVAIDGGGNQVFTLTSGTRTAAQVVADLSALTGATASVVTINGGTYVRIRTTSANGATSTILVNAPSNNANSLLGFTATTYTGGANVAGVFVGDTKQKIINGIETQLLAAGWITISGSGTTNLLMQSSMTPNPQNLRMRLRVKDNGNNCAVCSVENAFGTKQALNGTNNGGQLFPQSSKSWKVVANKYQAFIMVPGSITTRDFAAFGVPYLPSWLQGNVYEAAWLQGSAHDDADTTANSRFSFRTRLCQNASLGGGAGVVGQQLCNGNLWENPTDNTNGAQQLLVMTASSSFATSTTGVVAYRWHDGSAMMVDPIIVWGLASSADEGMARGQLWDAFISTEAYPIDTPLTSIDSHNWIGITANNTGNVNGGSDRRGTLFVVTP